MKNFVLPCLLISTFIYVCLYVLCTLCSCKGGVQKIITTNRGYARFIEMVNQLVETTTIQLLFAEKVLATKHQETLLWRA